MLQSMGSHRVGHNWVTELFVESCLTLCYPMDHSPPGSSVHAIFQARVLEWTAISFSRGSSQPQSPALQLDFLPAEPPGKSNHGLIVVVQ